MPVYLSVVYRRGFNFHTPKLDASISVPAKIINSDTATLIKTDTETIFLCLCIPSSERPRRINLVLPVVFDSGGF